MNSKICVSSLLFNVASLAISSTIQYREESQAFYRYFQCFWMNLTLSNVATHQAFISALFFPAASWHSHRALFFKRKVGSIY
jgi:hypothetical protein